MTRSKSRPQLRKPLFDEDEVLKFAASGGGLQAPAEQPVGATAEPGVKKHKTGKHQGGEQIPLTLMLSPAAVSHLKAAAERKGRTVEQVVEKLVAKHLGKH